MQIVSNNNYYAVNCTSVGFFSLWVVILASRLYRSAHKYVVRKKLFCFIYIHTLINSKLQFLIICLFTIYVYVKVILTIVSYVGNSNTELDLADICNKICTSLATDMTTYFQIYHLSSWDVYIQTALEVLAPHQCMVG